VRVFLTKNSFLLTKKVINKRIDLNIRKHRIIAMLSKREMLKIVGITAVLLSVVYYTIIISFISHGVFENISISEMFYFITSFFIMLFINLILGVYFISQYEFTKKIERELPTIITEIDPNISEEERKEYSQKLASKLKELIK